MADRMRLTKFWRWLLAAQVLVVLYLALSPRPPQTLDLGWDKLNHLLAFACMTVTARLAFGRIWGTLIVALLAYGGLIEILQSFVPNRSAEWADWFADGLGITLGIGLWLILRRLVPHEFPI